VLLEAGTASGREPSAIVELRSYLGQFLEEKEQSLGAEDERPFSLPLLHFRRTFAEKMFAIHGKVELLKRDKQALGSYARHYYDLFQLSGHSEVTTMLGSAEYAAIKADYDQISRAHFATELLLPRREEFCPQPRPVPTRGTCGSHRSRVRSPMPNAMLRPLSFMG
jgi:hypothetical protein